MRQEESWGKFALEMSFWLKLIFAPQEFEFYSRG